MAGYRRQGQCTVDHMLQQRHASHGVQYLGKLRMHALTLARGEDDDIQLHKMIPSIDV